MMSNRPRADPLVLDLLKSGVLKPGTELIYRDDQTEFPCVVSVDGTLEHDRRLYGNCAALVRAVTGKTVAKAYNHLFSGDRDLCRLRQEARRYGMLPRTSAPVPSSKDGIDVRALVEQGLVNPALPFVYRDKTTREHHAALTDDFKLRALDTGVVYDHLSGWVSTVMGTRANGWRFVTHQGKRMNVLREECRQARADTSRPSAASGAATGAAAAAAGGTAVTDHMDIVAEPQFDAPLCSVMSAESACAGSDAPTLVISPVLPPLAADDVASCSSSSSRNSGVGIGSSSADLDSSVGSSSSSGGDARSGSRLGLTPSSGTPISTWTSPATLTSADSSALGSAPPTSASLPNLAAAAAPAAVAGPMGAAAASDASASALQRRRGSSTTCNTSAAVPPRPLMPSIQLVDLLQVGILQAGQSIHMTTHKTTYACTVDSRGSLHADGRQFASLRAWTMSLALQARLNPWRLCQVGPYRLHSLHLLYLEEFSPSTPAGLRSLLQAGLIHAGDAVHWPELLGPQHAPLHVTATGELRIGGDSAHGPAQEPRVFPSLGALAVASRVARLRPGLVGEACVGGVRFAALRASLPSVPSPERVLGSKRVLLAPFAPLNDTADWVHRSRKRVHTAAADARAAAEPESAWHGLSPGENVAPEPEVETVPVLVPQGRPGLEQDSSTASSSWLPLDALLYSPRREEPDVVASLFTPCAVRPGSPLPLPRPANTSPPIPTAATTATAAGAPGAAAEAGLVLASLWGTDDLQRPMLTLLDPWAV